MLRWFRSLEAQLFLWAVLPVTFVIIALAFTGVYTHQRAMRDFVAARDTDLVRLMARVVEDGMAHGVIAVDGDRLAMWLLPLVGDQPDTAALIVVDSAGQAMIHPDPQLVGADVSSDPAVAVALAQPASPGSEGAVIVAEGQDEPVLVAFAPIRGTDWMVLIAEPVEDLIGPILRLSSLAPAVAIGAGVLSLLVLTFGWRTIVRPLQELARQSEQVSWGDYSAIAEPVGGVQEIRDLHGALADMVERIRSYQSGIQDYLGAVTRGQEAERARLARELHDGPVQELIALGHRSEMIQRRVERGEVKRAKVLLEEQRRAELEMVADVRRLIAALRPAYLEDLGFLPALGMLVRQIEQESLVSIRLETNGQVRRLSAEVELAVYRIAQEAMRNATQHAHARNIVIRVRSDQEGLILSIVDDGIGFTLPQRPDLLTQAGHFGLVSMRERATQLGGTLQITSSPGNGTELTVHLPDQPVLA